MLRRPFVAPRKGGAPILAVVSVLSLSLLAGTGLVAASASAVTIDFDGLAEGDIVTNQFPEATFSSDLGDTRVHFDPGTAPSHTPPNFLCSELCLAPVFIDFTLPVNDLTFWAINANVAHVSAHFNVFENGLFAGTATLVSSGGPSGHNEFVDLSGFVNVTRLEIVDIDEPGGIGWDTFIFTVPEPSTALLLGIGLLVAYAAKPSGTPT